MNNSRNENYDEETSDAGHCRPGIFRRFLQKHHTRRGTWWKRKRLNRLSSKLGLQNSQQEALQAIFAEMESVKLAVIDSRKNLGLGLAGAIQGESFNNELVREAMQEPINSIQLKMDLILISFAEWFNQLNHTQQQKLRETLQSRFTHCGAMGA